MSDNPTAHSFPQVYATLGIDLNKLGCVMMDAVPISVTDTIEATGARIYTSPNPERYWIKGAVAEHGAHVTLLYGLIWSGKVYRDVIDQVLEGFSCQRFRISEVGYFPSPFEDEPYWCLVAHVETAPNSPIMRAHQRLSLLPHIDTHLEYRPHMTLAYIQGTPEQRDAAIHALNEELIPRIMTAKPELNYGR